MFFAAARGGVRRRAAAAVVKVEAWRRGRECAPCRSGKRRMNRAICDAPTRLDRARTLGQRTRADGRAVDRERGGGQVARKGSGAAKHFFNHGSRAPPTHLDRARTFARRTRIVGRRRRTRAAAVEAAAADGRAIEEKGDEEHIFGHGRKGASTTSARIAERRHTSTERARLHLPVLMLVAI
jgi:hypothetical protein